VAVTVVVSAGVSLSVSGVTGRTGVQPTTAAISTMATPPLTPQFFHCIQNELFSRTLLGASSRRYGYGAIQRHYPCSKLVIIANADKHQIGSRNPDPFLPFVFVNRFAKK
jgi:hypothetical protein